MTASKLCALVACAIAASVVLVRPACAAPQAVEVVDEVSIGDRMSRIDVYSPAMNRVISNRVIRAAGDGPAPTLYLLTGAGGAEDGISWWDDTDVRDFFADKHVNVVLPTGGAFSLYTDWLADDPIAGRNRWQTYLTRELPAAVDTQLGTTGRNAIGGVSMSAGSAIDLAVQASDVYSAVASYSGCPWTSDPAGIAMASAVVMRGGGNPANMWGSPGGEVWRSHDPSINAGRLAGKTVYLSAASGIPGPIDRGGIPSPIIEAIASSCTGSFAARLTDLGMPPIYLNRPLGSHTWGQFETDLHDSWPHLARAIGA
ncbi:alpha/beta hydrolase [Nocardia jejuensis]|uniref:alpha/beta hydrolase n=1 Tax=Nocardia jejuensis TaxID=328049 RepID=UPI00082D6045|nr:alpha/beta hydrolase family protein [Nocardia jejuensis]